METKPIEKDSTVAYVDSYGEGYYRVSARFKNTVNLTGVWGGKIRYKGVPLDKVREAHNEWLEKWRKSEHYRCM